MIFFLSGCISIQKPNVNDLSYQKLEKFKSTDEFEGYLDSVRQINEYRHAKYLSEREESLCTDNCITVTGSRISAQDLSLTNNQVHGVDEGDIVKRKDNYLLILRRGKIYSVSIKSENANDIIPISSINVTPPGWNFDSWYDEMLVSDNKILVLGYSYDLGASEVLRFNLSTEGILSYQDGYLFRSGDYFDTENYASRLLNGKFITYMPNPLAGFEDEYGPEREFKTWLPKFAKIEGNHQDDLKWKDLISYKDITKPLQSDIEPVLHTIVTCNPLADEFSCNAKGLIGSPYTEYYVDRDAIYLWVQGWNKELLYDIDFDRDLDFLSILDEEVEHAKHLDAMVYRVSLSDESVTAMRVNGQPVNQFSFHSKDNNIYLYLIDEVYDDASVHSSVYKLPINEFSIEGNNFAQKASGLPHTYSEVSNRFSGNFLVTGSKSNFKWSRIDGTQMKSDFDLIVQKLDGQFQRVIRLKHSADRLEPIGSLMLISGLDINGDYNVTLIDIEHYGDLYSQKIFPELLEDELRSHAFNYKKVDDSLTIIGLTSLNKKDAKKQYSIYNYLWDDNLAADILFLGLDSQGSIFESGILKSSMNNAPESDDCETSCYDWYGNSRPFFIGDRIFGLSGDELIEAKLDGNTINAIERVDIRKTIKHISSNELEKLGVN